MKNILQQLGIQVKELSNLLFLSEQTLYAWFNRGTIIPPQYNDMIYPIKIYHTNRKEEDVEFLKNQWDTEHQAFLLEQSATALKELKNTLNQSTYALEKLKQKEKKLLNRWHFAENYTQYLKPELQNDANIQDWCSLISRKSKFQWRTIRLSILQMEQKIAGLEAEVAYWEKKNLYLNL